MPPSQVAFIAAPGQNAFFGELIDALAYELEELGCRSEVIDGYPRNGDGRPFVLVAPHEYAALHWHHALPDRSQLARTVAICTEQPGTPWFDLGARVAARSGAALDMNRSGVAALRRRGIAADHLPIGYSRRWEPAEAPDSRDIDICFMGGETERRKRLLARHGHVLQRHRCHLQVGDNSRPNPATSPVFLAGEDKRRVLARSRLLLNLHRDERSYFEWQRVLEAIACGAVVVSEHAHGHEPLEPGEHLLMGRPDSLGQICEGALADEAERERIAVAAREFARTQLPMRRAAEFLAAAVDRARARPAGAVRRLLAGPRLSVPGPEPTLAKVLDPLRRPNESAKQVRALVKQTRLEMLEVTRRVSELAERVERGAPAPAVEEIARSPSHRRAEPGVSVVVPLYNQGAFVVEALDSVARSTSGDLEVVIVDDGSTDGSAAAARDWIDGHPDVAALLVRHPVNRGLPQARNTGSGQARADRLLMLDSDNLLYPRCIERLGRALDEDPEAAFAYGILEVFEGTEPVSIRGHWGWDPERLASGNHIDALALIRRKPFEELGGFSTEPRLHGWEDYDLWCRMAERAMHAAHVPEIVARYRQRPDSMLSLTNISWEDSKAVMRERHPALFANAPGEDAAEALR